MANSKATVDSVLASLRSPRFSARPMFGEHAVYLDGKVVALVCDDRLFVKVHPATTALADECELAPPYPGAKDHYLLDEGQWASRQDLPQMLTGLAKELPEPRAKAKTPVTKASHAKRKPASAVPPTRPNRNSGNS